MIGVVGANGFVGSNLVRLLSNAVPISRHDLNAGISINFDVVVVAAPSATKWLIDSNPHEDLVNVRNLASQVARIRTNQIIHLSTIDVFVNKTADSEISARSTAPGYGGNRALFEDLLLAGCSNVLVRRLPGLYGRGLKKNLIFDLMNRRLEHLLTYNPLSEYQYMSVDNALRLALDDRFRNIQTMNLTAHPLTAAEIAGELRDFLSSTSPETHYNVRSMHAEVEGYFDSHEQSLTGVRRFLDSRNLP